MTSSKPQLMTLPLAPNADEHQKQLLCQIIKHNLSVDGFIRTYSNYADYPKDVCIICGNDQSICNCDGFFNDKS